METLIHWILEVGGAERQQRVEALKTLLAELKLQAERYERFQTAQEPKGMDETRARIRQLLLDLFQKLPVKN
jgi:coenzyme F420-reducing hydrogenase delta subunit